MLAAPARPPARVGGVPIVLSRGIRPFDGRFWLTCVKISDTRARGIRRPWEALRAGAPDRRAGDAARQDERLRLRAGDHRGDDMRGLCLQGPRPHHGGLVLGVARVQAGPGRRGDMPPLQEGIAAKAPLRRDFFMPWNRRVTHSTPLGHRESGGYERGVGAARGRGVPRTQEDTRVPHPERRLPQQGLP